MADRHRTRPLPTAAELRALAKLLLEMAETADHLDAIRTEEAGAR